MAAKDFITKGIGASPGSLLYWLNGGLGSGAVVVLPGSPIRSVVAFQSRTVTVAEDDRTSTLSASSRVVTMPRKPGAL